MKRFKQLTLLVSLVAVMMSTGCPEYTPQKVNDVQTDLNNARIVNLSTETAPGREPQVTC